MKNTKIYLILLAFALVFTSCEDEYTVFDGAQTALSFEEISFDLSVPQEDTTLEIPVYITTSSDQERTFQVVVTEETTEGNETEYNVGSIVIPANEYSGVLSIDFDYSEIDGPDGELRDLVVKIQPTGGISSYNDVATISYYREIICNDLELTIVSDIYASETAFSILYADGTPIVDEFFPFSSDALTAQTYNVSFTLPDGDYIFILHDSYGDGQYGCYNSTCLTGSYELSCSIIVHASGEGELADGGSETTYFSVNP